MLNSLVMILSVEAKRDRLTTFKYSLQMPLTIKYTVHKVVDDFICFLTLLLMLRILTGLILARQFMPSNF